MVNCDFDFYYFGEKIEQGQTLKDIGYYRGSTINVNAIPRSQTTNQRVSSAFLTNFDEDEHSQEEDEEEEEEDFFYDEYFVEEEDDEDEIESLNTLRNIIRFAARTNLYAHANEQRPGSIFPNHLRTNRPVGASTTSAIMKRKEKKHLYPFNVNLSEEDHETKAKCIEYKVQLGEEFRVLKKEVTQNIIDNLPEEKRATFVLNKQILNKLLHQNTRNKNVDITSDEANDVISNIARDYGMTNAKATRLYLLCSGDVTVIRSIADQLSGLDGNHNHNREHLSFIDLITDLYHERERHDSSDSGDSDGGVFQAYQSHNSDLEID